MDWRTALVEPSTLRERGLLIAEGRLVLERVLNGAAGGPDAVDAVLATPAAVLALQLEDRLPDRVTVRTPEEMASITGFNFHRGVIALVRRPAPMSLDDVLRVGGGAVTSGHAPVFVVAEHLVDVDNIGSCFRNARAFGAAGMLLDVRCPDPLYRKAIRTSLGHVLEVPWAQAQMDDIVAALARHDVTTVGLTPPGCEGSRPATTLARLATDLDRRRPVAVLLGNEGHGLSSGVLGNCTHLAGIPMAEGADSLNVATALAVALYELTRAG